MFQNDTNNSKKVERYDWVTPASRGEPWQRHLPMLRHLSVKAAMHLTPVSRWMTYKKFSHCKHVMKRGTIHQQQTSLFFKPACKNAFNPVTLGL